MKTVVGYMDINEAYLARGVLESEGIPAEVLDEHMPGIFGSPVMGGARLQVDDENVGRAWKSSA